jgi:tripartite-type tricarboxylate transporter receptor subunit TctC
MTIRTGGPITRRRAIAGLAASVAAPAIISAPARGQALWPAGRTIRMVVPFTPGGATDVIARIVSDKLARLWNTSVVVENKAGAGGNIGTEMVARSDPQRRDHADGHHRPGAEFVSLQKAQLRSDRRLYADLADLDHAEHADRA